MTASATPPAAARIARWIPACRRELAAARHRAGLAALARTHKRVTSARGPAR